MLCICPCVYDSHFLCKMEPQKAGSFEWVSVSGRLTYVCVCVCACVCACVWPCVCVRASVCVPVCYLGIVTRCLHLLLWLVPGELRCFLHFLELLSKLKQDEKNKQRKRLINTSSNENIKTHHWIQAMCVSLNDDVITCPKWNLIKSSATLAL